jgi:ribosomal protein L29
MTMKRESLTIKTADELRQMLAESRIALAKLRFDLADKKLQRTSDIGKTRRTIARIMTALKHTT